jgi:hypothetical protein
MLQIESVLQSASDYLLKCLSSTNCIGIYRYSDKYSLKKLNRTAKNFILDNYESLVGNSQEFNELSVDELSLFLSNDNLNIQSEEFAFESLMKWLNYDVASRLSFIHCMLQHIRLPLMDPVYFTNQIETNKLLLSNSKCQTILLEAATYHITPEKFFSSPSNVTVARRSTGTLTGF